MVVWGGLTNSWERREVKGKEEEKYAHLNAELQRIARWEKTAFLIKQNKQTEENNRMGKTRDLIKKIKDTKGTFHAKMGTIKDRKSMDLKKEDTRYLPHLPMWQDYTETIQKKFFFLIYYYFFTLFYFTILYWFCHTSTWICHRCTRVPNPEPIFLSSPVFPLVKGQAL